MPCNLDLVGKPYLTGLGIVRRGRSFPVILTGERWTVAIGSASRVSGNEDAIRGRMPRPSTALPRLANRSGDGKIRVAAVQTGSASCITRLSGRRDRCHGNSGKRLLVS